MPIVSRQPGEAPPRRIGALSVLPVFLNLQGKRALVIGGSDAAAWKAELLLAAGALVEVWAPHQSLGEQMQLIHKAAPTGSMQLVDRRWEVADFSDCAIIVADVSEAEAPLLVARTKDNGVPINVIDKPAFCDFQFGSIVNRSPIVVGISTNGAAPIFGQAVRRRIETVLPAALAGWATLAQTMRSRVMAALQPGARRRRFWETFSETAFLGKEPASETELMRWLRAGSQKSGGHVTLVGAGPGNAEHLTIKAVRALQAADVILFDDLVSDEVLELARREARRLVVGNRGYRKNCRQEDINALMIDLARQGKRVVRLKSGDPALCGGVGEELEALNAEGIGFDIVPGVTAASAFASAPGTSLTRLAPLTATRPLAESG